MLSTIITSGVVAVCIVWLFPHRIIHPISDRWHCRRMISKYRLDSREHYQHYRSDIVADLVHRTGRRYYDYGFQPIKGDPDWRNDEIHRPRHWRTNHAAAVKRILGLIRKKLSRRRFWRR